MIKDSQVFRDKIGRNIFNNKYKLYALQTWYEKAHDIVEDVTGTMWGRRSPLMSKGDRAQLAQYIAEMKFLPAGRYIYYAKRPNHSWNNCASKIGLEDTREEWARLIGDVTNILMNGAGLSVEYSVFRPRGQHLSRTGGTSTGPLALMNMMNEAGRHIIQGGSRRAALGALLHWQHGDAKELLTAKNWYGMAVGNTTIGKLKEQDFNYPAPLDMTNVSLRYDDAFLATEGLPDIFVENIRQSMRTAEPGLSFNFGKDSKEIARNVCMEFTSEDDDDLCNLGSINFSRIESIDELRDVVCLASKFLVCGSLRADLPYAKMKIVREKNRKIGLGIIGLHEWLLMRGYGYEVVDEMRDWLRVYASESEIAANSHCDRFYISRPKKYRAIAPGGSISMLAGTSSGMEPLYATAYKRRYLVGNDEWKYEYVVDSTAANLVASGVDPDTIETALSLASNPEKRIKFQADVQEYVDMAISSTINLPAWGTELNNEDKVIEFATLVKKYAPKLRGLTMYPDGARGGQPLTQCSYEEAKDKVGTVYTEHDVCSITGGGNCGD